MIKNKKNLSILVCVLGLGGLSVAARAEDDASAKGLAIARKVDAFNNGYEGEEATMEMVLVNANGERIERKLRSQRVEVEGEGERSKIEFSYPPDVKGTQMLTWTHKKQDDDQWLFLPAVRRVKRISSGNRTGSFMGSEFSYEDLSSPQVEKYKHILLGEEKLDGRLTWKLKRVPLDGESGYSQILVWMDQQYNQPLKVEYYDRKSQLLKTATFTGFTKFSKWYRPKSVEMVNHQTKKRSVLKLVEQKVGVAIRTSEFESSRLGG